ncbi:transposase [Streptomyces bottropensis]|uniref:Transposase n=1 Tax=Streptomyces bottropensis TaxID=42235 RepID=A0ABU8AZ14_9ACTN
MILIGIDPHKLTHTATAVDPETNRDHASIRIDVTLQEYQRMLEWARQWPGRRWAVENARGLGHHVSSWLLARGEQVVDVSPSATARVRQLSRGGGRKNDRVVAGCVVLPGGSGLGGDASGALVVAAQCLGDDGRRGLETEMSDGRGAALLGRDTEFPQRVLRT